MALRTNALRPIIEKLFDELLRIEHSSNIAEWVAKRMGDATTQQIAEYRAENVGVTTVMGSSNTLSVALLHSAPGHHSRHGAIETHDENLVLMIAELGARIRGDSLVRLYEVTEAFIADITGKLCWLKRNEWTFPNERKFRRQQVKPADVGTEEYYCRFVRDQCKHNSSEILAELCRRLPDFQAIQQSNWFQPDLLGCYRGFAFCRHKITHCGGRAERSELHRFSKPVKNWIDGMLQSSTYTGALTILPGKQHVRTSVEIVAALAYALYVEVSTSCSMHVDPPIQFGNVFGTTA